MKKIIATALVFGSSVLGLALVTACSAPAEEDSVLGIEELKGPGIWQVNRECGTKETGGCGQVAPCGENAIGGACPNAGARCVTAPIESGQRKILMCNATSTSTWTWLGDCKKEGCGKRPDCDKGDNVNDRCRFPQQRCAKGDRMLICLTDGKDQYTFSGYCGENGGPACANYPACPYDRDGIPGNSCDAVGTSCVHKLTNLTGKVFTCVSR